MSKSNELSLMPVITEPAVGTPITGTAEILFEDTPKSGNQGTGYYRILDDHSDENTKERGYAKGELAYVYAGNDALHAFIGDMHFTYQYDKPERIECFAENFQFVPNGAEERQKQIGQLMAEINDLDTTLSGTKTALSDFKPHIGGSGEMEGSTSLVPAATSMAQTKLAVATTRNNVLKTQKSLMAKTKLLKALASEQARALEIKVKEIQELAKRAEEAIWTINLYLGKEEEIVQLVTGKSAPANQKITIRQVALFMDEECGEFAEMNGIDYRNIGVFDDWLIAHPKNLAQILPEDKGIVALHIRRKAMDYKDPWLNKDLNEANLRWTYLLIRNGENVYRVYIDLDTGRHLFPDSDEFNTFFWYYDRETEERIPLKPGSKEWNEAMDASELRQKHYMRVLLVLQGLIDRTPIFRPMPTDRINLSDPRHCAEWLDLIYEAKNVITDGKPLFDEWQAEINNQLEVGCRIIGLFDYRSGVRGTKDRSGYGEDSRIYPENAKSPDSTDLHTIEDREKDMYIFRYERTGDTVYDRTNWRGHTPTVRARCWIKKDDDFILNFDAASLERLEYYQTHNLSRKFYAKMVPILEIAVNLKKQEIQDEAPFRLLLIGKIMERYGVSLNAAEEKVDELIKWWKFKNRTHRALVGENDTKAITMIVDEFGLRRKQEAIRQNAESTNDAVLRVVGAQTPSPVMIAHKKDNQYVAYIPSNDQNVWVTEQIWTYNRQTGVVRCKEAKQWKLIDKRHERWEILYKHDRWATWRINPPMSMILTDPEIEALTDAAIVAKGGYEADYKARKLARGEASAGHRRFLPLAVLVSDEFKIIFWYSSQEAIIPAERIITNHPDEPHIELFTVKWKRGANGVELEKYLGTSSQHCRYLAPGKRPWEQDFHGRPVEYRLVKKWDEHIEGVFQEQKNVRAHKNRVYDLKYSFEHVSGLVAQAMYDTEVAKAKMDFYADHGDPELWEDHLDGLKIVKRDPPGLDMALYMLLENGVYPEGMTLQQVYDEATKFGLLGDDDEVRYKRKLNKIPNNVPMDFVVPTARTPKPNTDEDDD